MISMTDEAPAGAAQALATGSSALLMVTVAFAAWWTFGTDADAAVVVALAAAGAVALAAVPLLAASASGSLRLARLAYVVGAVLALGAIGTGILMAFEGEEPESGSAEVSARAIACSIDCHIA
jgi:hypothetical protein